jgi:hypothetical protein
MDLPAYSLAQRAVNKLVSLQGTETDESIGYHERREMAAVIRADIDFRRVQTIFDQLGYFLGMHVFCPD